MCNMQTDRNCCDEFQQYLLSIVDQQIGQDPVRDDQIIQKHGCSAGPDHYRELCGPGQLGVQVFQDNYILNAGWFLL